MTQIKKQDIIQLILTDHKPLKKFIKILKDTEKPIFERQAAFEEFAPMLSLHAHAEEEALYKNIELDEELRVEGYEGEVEHMLAEQLIASVQGEQEEYMWTAKAKVLAELVEHHIEEEEEEMLPDVRKSLPVEMRQEIGAMYLEFKKKFEAGRADAEAIVNKDEDSMTETAASQLLAHH